MADNTSSPALLPAHPLLPPPFSTSTEPFTLIAQGAESLLFKTTWYSSTIDNTTGHIFAALKVRPDKKWRHPTLDKRLTRARILSEARVLVKLSGEGVASAIGAGGKKGKAKVKEPKDGDGGLRGSVPAVLALDWEGGWVVMEWIEGVMVKRAVSDTQTDRVEQGQEGAVEELRGLLRRMGELVGKLHAAGVVHGDLTTSNIMLRPHGADVYTETQPAVPISDDSARTSLSGDLVLIDFGLATQSVSDEDRAVDLYVLERAFGSTHPREEHLFGDVLQAYAESESSGMYGKAGEVVLRRLEDVRMRGRKKSMVG